MTFLPLGEPNGEKKPRKKFPILKSQLLAFGALAVLITGTFATNVSVGTNGRIEFGQGSVQVVTCDTFIGVSIQTRIDAATGLTYIDQLTLDDLSVQLHDRTISVEMYGNDGAKLNSELRFSIATDGLTFTSSRSHVEVIDAFTEGGGPRGERGVNRITFNNFAAEEPSKIEASKFSRVTLQTSGSGTCTVPSNIPAVAVYIDAPWVQGSYIAEDFPALTITDDYNSVTSTGMDCENFTFPVGTYSGGLCQIFTRDQDWGNYRWGGATTTTSTPTRAFRNDQSPSAFVGLPNGENITFGRSRNYIGFWWSAGSNGNSIKFYRNGTLFTTVTGNDVYQALPNNDNSGLNSTDRTANYVKSMYYGHPMNWPICDQYDDPVYIDSFDPNCLNDPNDPNDPIDTNDQNEVFYADPREPYVFMHIFALNGFNFDSVNISTTGNGFEWDNLSVATLRNADLTPRGSLVKIAEYIYNF